MNPPTTYPQFDADTYRELGVYVYALCDPRNGEIFYVGKGQDDRWWRHIFDSRKDGIDAPASEKLDRIRDIERSGHTVQVHFLRSGLPTTRSGDDLGFLIEASVIDALRLVSELNPSSMGRLTNLVSGHESIGRARISLAQAAQLFTAEPIGPITEPVMLLNLARTWTPELSDEDLWEFTRSAWLCVPPRRDKVKFVLAVSYGIVRAVYEVSSWRPWRPGDRNYNPSDQMRYVVESSHAPQSHPQMAKYVQRSVKELMKGKMSPFLYINC